MALIPSRNRTFVGTLDKFGVPTGDGRTPGQLLMPKLKHRFRVEVNNFGINTGLFEFTRQVATAGRPQLQHNNTPLHSYNNVAYYANKPEWQPIEISLRDDIRNSVSSLVSSQMQKQMNHFTQSAARSHVDYKFIMRMQTLDGTMEYDQNVIEEWILEGCFIDQVQYDTMDYSSSDPTMITLTIRYDNATQGNEALLATISSITGI